MPKMIKSQNCTSDMDDDINDVGALLLHSKRRKVLEQHSIVFCIHLERVTPDNVKCVSATLPDDEVVTALPQAVIT
jgi:hypothetical protein